MRTNQDPRDVGDKTSRCDVSDFTGRLFLNDDDDDDDENE